MGRDQVQGTGAGTGERAQVQAGAEQVQVTARSELGRPLKRH
jgi:hypothetical protein